MSNKITGKEFPLSKIFSSDFEYHIPTYQRPYSWTEDETGILFDDLYDFYKTQNNENYFLGSIVLIKNDFDTKAEVIDGQQRLTTLSILLSVIADSFDGELKEDYKTYLKEPGRESQNILPSPRLYLREKDQSFFNKYIQEINLQELFKINIEDLDSEAKKHVLKNTNLLFNRVSDTFQGNVDELKKFGSFLVQQCFLVMVYTPSQTSAFRVFSVMNSRGLDLLPTDIIKADVISKIQDHEKDYYTKTWEQIEDLTTRNGFNDLFTYIRMIFAKTKSKRNLLEEFREHVLSKFDSKTFINDIIEPYSYAYLTLKNKSFNGTKQTDRINELLEWLNKIDNSDWFPPAIKFLSIYKDYEDKILWFLKKLERLSAYLYITGKDVNKRIERYSKIISEIEGENNIQSLELSISERKDFLDKLNGDIYKLTAKRRNYIILRLDSFTSDMGAKYNHNTLTIEHILPQSIKKGSQWDIIWADLETRKMWLNKIANLIPLTRAKNSEAQNYDFARKKELYYSSKKGVTTFSLTTEILKEKEWTPKSIELRQKVLLDRFKSHWDLNFPETNPNESSTDTIIVKEENNISYDNLLEQFISRPRNLKLKSGIYAYFYVENNVICVYKAINLSPNEKSSRLKAPQQLTKDDFERIVEMKNKIPNLNVFSSDDLKNNIHTLSYWWAIFNELNL